MSLEVLHTQGDNIFVVTNITSAVSKKTVRRLVNVFQAAGQATRLKILFAIGEGEACVCHLEAVLKIRQATISQHLMTLRQAGLVTSRRDGRNIFYRLADPTVLDLLADAAALAELPAEALPVAPADDRPAPACECPSCAAVRQDVEKVKELT